MTNDRPYFSPLFGLTEAQTREIAKRGAVPGFLAVQILEIVVSQCDDAVRHAEGAMLTRKESRRRAKRQTPSAA